MRKWKVALLALAVVCVPAVAGSIAQATAFRSGEVVKTEKNEKINHTLFTAGEEITVEADVNGDVFCAGMSVTINGTVSGDVVCAAQTIRINGIVEGNIRVAALDVTLMGRVNGNASVAAQSFVMDSKASIGQDLSVAASTATVNGAVKRDAVLASQEAQLNGPVGRDVTAAVDNLSLGRDTTVAGNVHYYSFSEAQRASDAKIAGDMVRHDPPQSEAEPQPTFGAMLLDFVITTTMVLLVGALLAAIFPRMLQNLTNHALQRPGTVALTGAVAIFAIPVAIVLAFIIVAGLLLSGILLVGSMLILMVSAPLFGHFIGTLVFKKQPQMHPVLVTLVGIFILSLIQLIPVVGFVVAVIGFAYALGVVLTGAVRYNFDQPQTPANPKAKLAVKS